MKKTTLLLAFVLSASLMTTGCAVNRATATVDPSSDLRALKTLHVTKLESDGRGIDVLIADKLRSRGLTVTTGPNRAPGADAVVTYADKWMWDLTMYMIELTITVRDPGNDYPLASGNSFHTSLTRLSPAEMVSEVVDNIFKPVK